MVYSLALFFITLFACAGYGAVLARFVYAESVLSRSQFFINVTLGLLISGLMGSLLNFIIPVSAIVSYAYLTLGFAVFLFAYRNQIKIWLEEPSLFAGLFVLMSILFVAYSLDNNTIEDSGLYHIQLIKWMKEDRVVLGLANLHDRFGFNSLWLSVCALLTPEVETNHYVDLTLTVLFMSTLGLLWSEFKAHRNKIALFILVLVLTVWGKDQLFQGLGSPATDTPSALIFILALFCLYQRDKNSLLNVILFSAFAVLVKLSQVGLVFAFLLAAISLYKEAPKLLLRPLLVCATLVMVWSGRGLLLSGCLVYPQELTCFPQIQWTPPKSETIEAKLWIQSWARQEQVPYQQVLKDSQWLHSWIESNFQKARFLVSLALLLLGVGFAALRLRQQKQEWEVCVFVAAVCSLIPWFILAPDLRFASGAFVSLGALALSLIPWCQPRAQIKKAGLVVLSLYGVVYFLDLARIAKSATRTHPWEKTFAGVALGAIRTEVNPNGVTYNLPDVGNDKCWLAPLPCVPFPKPHLKETTFGEYKAYCTDCGENHVVQ